MQKEHEQFKYTTGVVGYPIAFVMLIWIIFWFEVRFNVNFNSFGIYPRTAEGLKGILFSPFIHGDIEHLYHNSIPLLVLSMALFYFYRPISWKILCYGILLSGLLTWAIGRRSYHIGASSIIYVLFSFIFFKGVFAKYFRLIALSLIVVFLYGSMIWYVFPIKNGISWEGHLSGLIVGFIFALFFNKSIAKAKKYVWEEENYNEEDDPFLKHFDENGNFIENIYESSDNDSISEIKINYKYKESNED